MLARGVGLGRCKGAAYTCFHRRCGSTYGMVGKTSPSTGPSSYHPQPSPKSQVYSDQVLTAAKRSLVMRPQARNSKWFHLCVKSNKSVVAAYRPVLRRILKLYSIQLTRKINAGTDFSCPSLVWEWGATESMQVTCILTPYKTAWGLPWWSSG